jgi:hypothetical protein
LIHQFYSAMELNIVNRVEDMRKLLKGMLIPGHNIFYDNVNLIL